MTLTAASWALLGAAALLAPGATAAQRRAAAIAARGRTGAASAPVAGAGSGRRTATALPVVAAAGAATVTFVLGGAGPGLAVAIAAATGAHLTVRAGRDRAARRRAHLLLAAIRLLVAELAAGADAAAALRAAAEVAPDHRDELMHAARACAAGAVASFTSAELAPLQQAWQLATVTGAPIAGALERVAFDLEAQQAHRQAVTVAAAGAQASAGMLAALPVLGVMLGLAMGARPLHVLFGTPTGGPLVLLGVALDCAGVLWTARLTARAARA